LGHGGYVWEENLKEAVNRILYQHTGAEDIYFAAIQKFSNLNHSYGVLKRFSGLLEQTVSIRWLLCFSGFS
jgi:hypothetical protein